LSSGAPLWAFSQRRCHSPPPYLRASNRPPKAPGRCHRLRRRPLRARTRPPLPPLLSPFPSLSSGPRTFLPAPRILLGLPGTTTPAVQGVSNLAELPASYYSRLLNLFPEWQAQPEEMKAVAIRSFGPKQIFETLQEKNKLTEAEKARTA